MMRRRRPAWDEDEDETDSEAESHRALSSSLVTKRPLSPGQRVMTVWYGADSSQTDIFVVRPAESSTTCAVDPVDATVTVSSQLPRCAPKRIQNFCDRLRTTVNDSRCVSLT